MIEREEIMRIIDDLKTKQKQTEEEYDRYILRQALTPRFMNQYQAYQYAIDRLKEII